jgi:invasion protein IalB
MESKRHRSAPFGALALTLVFGCAASSAAAQDRPPGSFQVAQARPGAAAGANQPKLIEQFGDWGAYSGGRAGAKVCFALAKPSSSQTNPPNRPRDPAYFFLTSRPADNVRNEVSVVIGYPFRPNSEATAEVGATKFSMYTESDGAWIKDSSEEARLVDAMRKSPELVIKGVSGRGTQTTDRYSLKGLSQALDRINQECK